MALGARHRLTRGNCMRDNPDRIQESKMDLRLAGKTVLITGASKGIGLAAARAFAAEGCNLHLAARSGDALANARDEIVREHGVEVAIQALDLGRTENVVALGRRCAHVDILVNN